MRDQLRKEKYVVRIFFCLLLLLTIALIPSTALSQTDPSRPRNPRPTPTPEVPEVVSRDADIEKMIRERTDPDSNPVPVSGVQNDQAGQAAENRLALDSLSAADQQRLLLYLDMLTKLEQRAESLRSQLISLTEKENTISTKIQMIESNLRPDAITNFTALSGSLRPEALREQRKTDLEFEKKNLETLLFQIQASRSNLEANLRRADDMAERMRIRFESILDAAFQVETNP